MRYVEPSSSPDNAEGLAGLRDRPRPRRREKLDANKDDKVKPGPAFEIDAGKLAEEARYDGIFVLRTNAARVTPLQAMLRYRELLAMETLFRKMKSVLCTRPIYHSADAAIRGHVFCSFLALVLQNELLRRCRAVGVDDGKLVKGLKLLVVCDKHGSLLDLELHPVNTDDRAGALPMLPRLAALGFEGDLLGDSAFRGAPFAAAALAHDIQVSVLPGGTRDGHFLPRGIRRVVERLLAWMSCYRLLNIAYDRAPEIFAAHVWITMISIISRRLVVQAQAQTQAKHGI